MPKDSGFVAGTLVHTKEGLKPIEQIKVGDYVLSKLEDGSGEPSYKRVTRTFEREGKEIWMVYFNPLGEAEKEEFVVATAEHPFRVKRATNFVDDEHEESIWVITYNLHMRLGRSEEIFFELMDGREARCSGVSPIVALSTPDHGVIYTEYGLGDGNDGTALDFSKGHPAYLGWETKYGRTLPKSVFADLPNNLSLDNLPPDSVTVATSGHPPLLRKVYNLEVEDSHIYYVGECGVLVCSTTSVTTKEN